MISNESVNAIMYRILHNARIIADNIILNYREQMPAPYFDLFQDTPRTPRPPQKASEHSKSLETHSH